MNISAASSSDLPHLARLLWLHASAEEQGSQGAAAVAVDLSAWWADHADTHFAFVARPTEAAVVGMAWLALVPRVPRPGAPSRRSGDIQSVFVMPEYRGRRIGEALVQAASQHAASLGVSRVTVHSSGKAVPLYERLGFAVSRELLQREMPPADG